MTLTRFYIGKGDIARPLPGSATGQRQLKHISQVLNKCCEILCSKFITLQFINMLSQRAILLKFLFIVHALHNLGSWN